jgi:ferredoxin
MDSGHALRLVIDRAACVGHGLCYGHAPEIVDSDDQGDPILLVAEISPDRQAQAQSLIARCPEQALSFAPIEASTTETGATPK